MILDTLTTRDRMHGVTYMYTCGVIEGDGDVEGRGSCGESVAVHVIQLVVDCRMTWME